MTLVIIMALVALISFGIGVSYERARNEAATIAALQQIQDDIVFNQAHPSGSNPALDWYDLHDPVGQMWRDPVMLEAFSLMPRRPHMHVAHDTSVDQHFDDLMARGLIEGS